MDRAMAGSGVIEDDFHTLAQTETRRSVWRDIAGKPKGSGR
jgi:hypothetical protein